MQNKNLGNIQRKNENKMKLIESMKNKKCELVSEYVNSRTPVIYMYDNLEYRVKPILWNKGFFPHERKRLGRYDSKYVKGILEKEGCELVGEYVNSNKPIKYLFDSKEYTVYFKDWLHIHARPHLRKK